MDPLRRTGRTTRMLESAKDGDHVVFACKAAGRLWEKRFPKLHFHSIQHTPDALRGSRGAIWVDHDAVELAMVSDNLALLANLNIIRSMQRAGPWL